LTAVLLIGVPVLRVVVPFRLADALAGQPGSVRWFASFAVSEVGGYWGHRLSHEIPMLWRFHRVHHSAPQLDWLAPNRRHPIDAIIARSSTALPVLALGFGVPTVATHFALKRLQGLFVHSNTRLRFGPFERVLVTPFFHHWHHSATAGTWNTNYAGSLPLVDWIFGTMQLPARWPQEYGCDGDVPDVGYIARVMSAWPRATTGRPVGPGSAGFGERASRPIPGGGEAQAGVAGAHVGAGRVGPGDRLLIRADRRFIDLDAEARRIAEANPALLDGLVDRDAHRRGQVLQFAHEVVRYGGRGVGEDVPVVTHRADRQIVGEGERGHAQEVCDPPHTAGLDHAHCPGIEQRPILLEAGQVLAGGHGGAR
jgi:hypothetical protein